MFSLRIYTRMYAICAYLCSTQFIHVELRMYFVAIFCFVGHAAYKHDVSMVDGAFSVSSVRDAGRRLQRHRQGFLTRLTSVPLADRPVETPISQFVC